MYCLELSRNNQDEQLYVIDSGFRGNHARFINHHVCNRQFETSDCKVFEGREVKNPVYRQLGDSNSQWHNKKFKKVPVGGSASWVLSWTGTSPKWHFLQFFVPLRIWVPHMPVQPQIRNFLGILEIRHFLSRLEFRPTTRVSGDPGFPAFFHLRGDFFDVWILIPGNRDFS